MKRFRWPLQRLLDVTVHKEEALRSQLVALTHEIVRIRQEIVVRKALLRAALAELAREEIERRIARHEVVMRSGDVLQRQIDRLEAERAACSRRKADKTQELLKVRSSRETLERLREEAGQRYVRQQAALEQKVLDETAQVAFARNALMRQRGGPTEESADD